MLKKGDRKVLKRKIKRAISKFDEIDKQDEQCKSTRRMREDQMALTEESIQMEAAKEEVRLTQPDEEIESEVRDSKMFSFMNPKGSVASVEYSDQLVLEVVDDHQMNIKIGSDKSKKGSDKNKKLPEIVVRNASQVSQDIRQREPSPYEQHEHRS